MQHFPRACSHLHTPISGVSDVTNQGNEMLLSKVTDIALKVYL